MKGSTLTFNVIDGEFDEFDIMSREEMPAAGEEEVPAEDATMSDEEISDEYNEGYGMDDEDLELESIIRELEGDLDMPAEDEIDIEDETVMEGDYSEKEEIEEDIDSIIEAILREEDYETEGDVSAKDEDGTIIDFFGGLQALEEKTLITPLPTRETFDDDPLRILRAIRFYITKGFDISSSIYVCIKDYDYETKMGVVSTERIREELFKCFKHDTLRTIKILEEFPELKRYIFKGNTLWLKPTMEQ
jgi:hypothetical protein